MIPLVFATGAGSAARHSLGTVVFGGMLVSTFLNLAITPVLYVIIKSLELRGKMCIRDSTAVVRDGHKTGCSLFEQCLDEIVRNPVEPKSAHRDGAAAGNVGHRLGAGRIDLLHAA